MKKLGFLIMTILIARCDKIFQQICTFCEIECSNVKSGISFNYSKFHVCPSTTRLFYIQVEQYLESVLNKIGI